MDKQSRTKTKLKTLFWQKLCVIKIIVPPKISSKMLIFGLKLVFFLVVLFFQQECNTFLLQIFHIFISLSEKSDTKDSKEEKTNSSTTAASTNENDDDNKFDWVLSVGVATVAMLSYAVNAGLIQLRRAATN